MYTYICNRRTIETTHMLGFKLHILLKGEKALTSLVIKTELKICSNNTQTNH